LEVALLDPRFQAAEIPERIQGALGIARSDVAGDAFFPSVSVTAAPVAVGPAPAPQKRATVDDAVAAYLRFIASENVPLHVANKVSILRRFIGAHRVEAAGGPAKSKRQRLKNGDAVPDPAPFFTGTHLDEISPLLVQTFLEGLGVSRKTMRHYRETIHHFFEFCLKFDLYQPENWHRPNPISALPSYVSRNRHIVFLTQAQVDKQIASLACDPAVQMAATFMIYAGLRRAETLWLTRDSISPDVSYLSVLNRRDEDSATESSLKTGERAVTILPPLRQAVLQYLSGSCGKWLIPNPKGKRWRPDSFSARLRELNTNAGLTWTCLPYRHTYATQRAQAGWSLFQISKEMGNSAAVVEDYYAGYIRPCKAA